MRRARGVAQEANTRDPAKGQGKVEMAISTAFPSLLE
jgi:hypothetical protein